MTTSKDLITGAIHLYALGMILVVVNYLIVIALFYIGISTHTTISTRIILATSTSIVKLLFDVTILKWFLKNDYELLDIIIVGFQFGSILWFLNLLNIFGLLKSLDLVDFTLWSVIYFDTFEPRLGSSTQQHYSLNPWEDEDHRNWIIHHMSIALLHPHHL
jgi:hypothetical protein